ncbi:MAG: hypothetical protein JXB49_25380 [Bacteroidales bacterium]|nr:hypothetical protein [Bacteroidales bacterium]
MNESIKPGIKILKENKVYVRSDTDFAAFARFHQNEWRVVNNLPISKYNKRQKNDKGRIVYLPEYIGNLIEKESAFDTGSNFLNDNIKEVVEKCLKNKEKGAKIEKNRLYTNLLSSQPLAFNLFAELSLNLDLATKLFNKRFPDSVKEVTKIIFEHSDGRGDLGYTGDHSAFDVFVEYQLDNGKMGFYGIEVKYAENLKDKPAKYKERYGELTKMSGLFKPGSLAALKKKPIEQIWRDHLLAIAHLHHPKSEYSKGAFIYLYPKLNKECELGIKTYKEQFIGNDEEKNGFYTWHIEDLVEYLAEIDNSDWIKKFRKRYLGTPTIIL